MPPKRCPECGRFLSNELVASLADASLPCPRCGTPLEADKLVAGGRSSRRAQRESAAEAQVATASALSGAGREAADGDGDGGDALGDGDGGDAADGGGDGDAPDGGDALGDGDGGGDGDAPDGDAVPSVRPPDLDPAQVRAPGDDVLAAWDVGVSPDEVASWRADSRPFPTDAAMVAGAALLGGVLGAALTERSRALGIAIGVLGGGIAAGVARRIWELEG